jgi:hypothetical protein
MWSLPNSVSHRSCTFASWSSKERHQSMMKLQGQSATMITNTATPSECTTSTPMAVDHQRIGKRTLSHLSKKETRGPSTRDQISSVSEVARQAEAMVAAEAHSHTSLHIACIMAAIPITA